MDEVRSQHTVSAGVYDIIYQDIIDYDAHVVELLSVIEDRSPNATSLLEMACGTGQFLTRLAPHFDVVGSDLSTEMLAVCAAKYPDLETHLGDYATIDLGRRFDAVLCLFSSIGYTVTAEGMATALANFARHTLPGGVVIVDGWLRPDQAIDGYRSMRTFEGEGMLVARSTLTAIEEVGNTDMLAAHLVNDGTTIEHFVERHVMGLHSDATYLEVMRGAGLTDLTVIDGYDGRGRFVGSKP